MMIITAQGDAAPLEACAPEEFVSIDPGAAGFVLDLRYATANNFTGRPVYPRADLLILRAGTARKLIAAQRQFQAQGVRLKIWDAYRPMAAQFTLFDLLGDPTFLANPYTGGSCHSKGCAVDVTLADAAGRELELPSDFDDFTGAGSRHNAAMSPAARRNMDLLTTVLVGCGFRAINDEWWHYDDTERERYGLVELDLDRFCPKTEK